MSPRWASVAGYNLCFYHSEEHQRPHVEVRRRGGREKATVDVLTGEVLSGKLPHAVHRQVRELLKQHREEAVEAFYETLAKRPPRKLTDERNEEKP